MLDLAPANHTAALAREERVLLHMETARQQLAVAKTLDDAKQVADAAAAVCEWLRRQAGLGLEIVNDGQLLKLQAEKRMGEFLRQPDNARERGRPAKIPTDGGFSPYSRERLGISTQAAHRYKQVAEVPEETLQELAAKATRAGRELSRRSVLRVAKKAQPITVPVQAPPLGFTDLLNQVTTGDARELAKLIPDNSVALAFADPVYDRLDDYEWLARECERVLIPGGSVVAQCGNMRRYEAETVMRRSGLQFVDLLAEVYPYALCPLFPIRVQVGWKPYLWFSKGPRLGEWMMNRVHAKGKHSAKDSKDLHEWGDAEEFAAGVLGKLCGPADVVFDPFTGSGTVPVTAKRLGLPFVAFEVDAEAAELARRRLAGTLRTETPQQTLCLDEITGAAAP